MASQKTSIIEKLFQDTTRWNGSALIRPMVTLDEVQKAIKVHNANPGAHKISEKNPANFFKDFVRKVKSAEKNWPPSVLQAGYTGVQQTGAGNSFEFIPLPDGQTTAFAAKAAIYPRNPSATKISVMETLSLDVMTKALARKDENWIQSISVSLHIPQAHFALHPNETLPFVQVGHMQSNLKLRKTEIDGLFYGHLAGGNVALMTMEAKGDSDDILDSQVLDQIEAVQNMGEAKTLLAFMKTTEADTIILPMLRILANVTTDSG